MASDFEPGAPQPPDGGGLSTGAKWALGLGAVALIVAGFLVAKGGSDNGSSTVTVVRTAAAQQTVTTTVTTGGKTVTETTPAQTVTTQGPPAAKTSVVTVAGGKPVGGVKTLTYGKGDEVRLVVHSDTADEVHVHGYDLKMDVPAGDSVTFDFQATIDGRFVIELEKSGTQIATLQVDP